MAQLSDKELLEMYNGENPNYAFNLIVRKYQERLYYHVRRMVYNHEDANDVIQNAFIKAWKGLGKFRSEANLYTWLYRIAANESLTFLAKRNKNRTIDMESIPQQFTGNLEADAFFDGDEAYAKLQAAIKTLPDKQKVVFNLKYYDELKYEEIAEITGTSVGALKASYFHAVKKIEAAIKSD